ncbi:hypothetical protein PSY31_23680, partial [Shigella flexneri]|nr:hypothetical protein [Shigella flexneri]
DPYDSLSWFKFFWPTKIHSIVEMKKYEVAFTLEKGARIVEELLISSDEDLERTVQIEEAVIKSRYKYRERTHKSVEFLDDQL